MNFEISEQINERSTCNFHETLNFLGIRFIHVLTKRDPPVCPDWNHNLSVMGWVTRSTRMRAGGGILGCRSILTLRVSLQSPSLVDLAKCPGARNRTTFLRLAELFNKWAGTNLSFLLNSVLCWWLEARSARPGRLQFSWPVISDVVDVVCDVARTRVSSTNANEDMVVFGWTCRKEILQAAYLEKREENQNSWPPNQDSFITSKDPYLTTLRTSVCIPKSTDRAGALHALIPISLVASTAASQTPRYKTAVVLASLFKITSIWLPVLFGTPHS